MRLNLTQKDFVKNIKRSEFIISNPGTLKEPMEFVVDKIRKSYSEHEFDTLMDFSKCQTLIIALGKAKKYNEADRVIEIAKRTLRTLKGEVRILGCIFLYPSFAYYAKKRNNLSLAKKYITITINYDDTLTDKFPILHLHKLHHTTNLNQIYLATKDYKKCADFMASIFRYLYTFKLNPKYGIGGEKLFKAMQPYISHSDVVSGFMEEYFYCISDYPEVLAHTIDNNELEKMLTNHPPPEEYTSTLRDFWMIQKSFKNNSPDYEAIYSFFDRHNFYTSDSLKLLIFQKIYQSLTNEEDKSLILEAVSKLNFKYPEALIGKFFN